MATANLTAERARAIFQYDQETGELRRHSSTKSRPMTNSAGAGYLSFKVGGRRYLAHRIVWLHVTGQWPTGQIDHINGIKTDNRFENLRDVSRSKNKQNSRRPHKDNASKLLGVSLRKATGKWVAQIYHQKKNVYLGDFNTPEEAHSAYLKAKRTLHAGCTI